MEKKIKYSVLRYSPRMQVGEAINLGILIADEENKLIKFVYTKKKNRIEAFDDEIKYNVVLKLLRSIEAEVSDILRKEADFSVEKFIAFYINAFRFEPPTYLIYEDFETTVEDLRKVYLWFDYDKSNRISKKDSIKFLRQILESKGEKAYCRKSDVGEFQDEIYYDLQTNKYNIVLFDVNKKNLSKQINSAKLWSWNADHHSPDRDLLFVLKTDDVEKKEYEILQRVLDDSGVDVLEYEDAVRKIVDGA